MYVYTGSEIFRSVQLYFKLKIELIERNKKLREYLKKQVSEKKVLKPF